ncbi:MAG: N-formylglutamate amidohydrolase [Tabrizicola sp.]|nr:N-formylglutamate amidohydrolase [Tabrizicola sp.]
MQPPVEVVNAGGRSRYVLLCEHASNWIPPDYDRLGLPEAELSRHIAWDIGAVWMARRLSQRLDAPLVLAGASRLLIDLNRPLGSAGSIPERSEATDIPGNIGLDPAERKRREDRWFHPFQAEVTGLLDRRKAGGQPTVVLGIHSFTPVYLGAARPWEAGVLYRHSQGFGGWLVDQLGGEAAGIAHNQPYQIEDGGDYTVPMHGEARGLDAVLIEVRQDLVSTPRTAQAWGDRLAEALARI